MFYKDLDTCILNKLSKKQVLTCSLVCKKWNTYSKRIIIRSYSNLNWLHLENNQLTQIPKELGQLLNLNRLWLQNNQLTQIPKELGQLLNLEWLDLKNNQLTQIPKELGQLLNLEWLRLENNQLTQIPKELGQLPIYNKKQIFLL